MIINPLMFRPCRWATRAERRPSARLAMSTLALKFDAYCPDNALQMTFAFHL